MGRNRSTRDPNLMNPACWSWRAVPPTGAYETMRLAMAPAIWRMRMVFPLLHSMTMVVRSFSVEDFGLPLNLMLSCAAKIVEGDFAKALAACAAEQA